MYCLVITTTHYCKNLINYIINSCKHYKNIILIQHWQLLLLQKSLVYVSREDIAITKNSHKNPKIKLWPLYWFIKKKNCTNLNEIIIRVFKKIQRTHLCKNVLSTILYFMWLNVDDIKTRYVWCVVLKIFGNSPISR